MLGRTTKFIPAEQKISLIQITGYDDKNFQGTLQNAYYPEKRIFSNLTQLLLLIEHLQDELQFPQKGMEIRSFKKSPPLQTHHLEPPDGDPKATFKLHLLFRQNASWQGSVIWMEEGLEAQFRSALELVTLMDSVLAS